MRKPKHWYDPRAYIPGGSHPWKVYAAYLADAGFIVVRENQWMPITKDMKKDVLCFNKETGEYWFGAPCKNHAPNNVWQPLPDPPEVD
jgi:hypothetical protein